MNIKILFCIVSYLSPSLVLADKSLFEIKSEGMNLKIELVAEGFSIPWGLSFISSKKLLVTERSGTVYMLDVNKRTKVKIENLPKVMAAGQGGLLDVALSPNYKKTGWVYFTYVKEVTDKGATVLARSRIKNNKFSQWQDLLISKSTTDTTYHFGSRIAFDYKGHVFFSIGDRGIRPNGQNLKTHAGSIIRLNLNGSIPNDNPFVKTKNALSEIWSYGHRNPQGLTYDRVHKRLWSNEHGPRGGDEINLIVRGGNYGWPIISQGKEYWGPIAVGEAKHRKGMQDPVKVYIPSIAPSSLIMYTGNAMQKWKGDLFSGALKLQHINRVVIDIAGKSIKEERIIESLKERIRAVIQSPEGWLYFSTDQGNIFRIRPK